MSGYVVALAAVGGGVVGFVLGRWWQLLSALPDPVGRGEFERLVALALLGRSDGEVGDVISDEVWKQLHDDGLAATTRDMTDEYETYLTEAGSAALDETARRMFPEAD